MALTENNLHSLCNVFKQCSKINFFRWSTASFHAVTVASASLWCTAFDHLWVNLTGRPIDDLMNFGWVDLVHPNDKEGFLNIYLKAFEKKEPFTGKLRILNKEGEYRWLLVKAPVRFRPDGSFAGYIS